LVLKYKRTDWFTLFAAELKFRNLVGRYAFALALPSPNDKEALAQLGMQLAKEMYGIDVTSEEVSEILEAAIGLCEEDYKQAIDDTIEGIEAQIN
jgi:hypothetical protein